MDKQELLKSLEEWKKYRKSENHELQYYQLAEVINLVEKLDEPQKLKVKQYVADWYEEHKQNLSNSLWEFTVELNEKTIANGVVYTKFESWFIDHPRAYEVITSMENGYEVEQEPKFVLKHQNGMYFTRFNEEMEPLLGGEKRAYRFTDESKAEALTIFFNGTVEKVEDGE